MAATKHDRSTFADVQNCYCVEKGVVIPFTFLDDPAGSPRRRVVPHRVQPSASTATKPVPPWAEIVTKLVHGVALVACPVAFS